MVNKCVVYGCNHPSGHRFPIEKSNRKQWIHRIRREGREKRKHFVPTVNSVICQKHFRPDDYISGPKANGGFERKKKVLKPNAVPSVFIWSKPPSEKDNAREIRRNRKASKQHGSENVAVKSSIVDNALDMDKADTIVVDDSVVESAAEQIVEHATNGPQGPDNEEADDRERPFSSTGVQAEILTPVPFLAAERLRHDEELLHYYTGLETYNKFLTAFRSLGPAVNCLQYYRSCVMKMSPLNQFLLMLVKLRQDIAYIQLSRMCEVSVSTAENIFITWVNFCSRQWGEIDTWTSQELVRFFAPSDFKRKFPTTRVILDGTEIPVQRPCHPTAQRATFSTYKNRNTVKTVVGVRPGGMVSYISPVYAGSASDRQIIERSQLPEMCDAGDSIMADKRFNVQDLFATKDVQVNIPAFFTKKNILTSNQVLTDRKIASKRVHIERVIGQAKTYKCAHSMHLRLSLPSTLFLFAFSCAICVRKLCLRQRDLMRNLQYMYLHVS